MSSFDLNALSGINASSQGLSVIANNLANAESVGFKASRTEFADLFSGAQNSPGNGVRVSSITQNFTQGTINGTGRELDMAIDGEGFFILEDQTGKYENVYTRNGSFKLNQDGYLTTQEGNRVQGYLLNETLSNETTSVFETTLDDIDLDALNRTPKATNEMTFDINLDGEEANNQDLSNFGVAATDAANRSNILKLVDFENGTNVATDGYTGFPDFSTNKIIHDSLGGEHRLTANYFKRDVVSQANSTIAGDGTAVAAGAGVKYTSWLVQYTMQDYDEANDTWVTSGHVADATGNLMSAAGGGATFPTPAPAGSNRLEGQLFEMRFDTDGNLIGTFEPADVAAPVGLANATTNSELPAASWNQITGTPTLNWVVDEPFSGATDPLGGTQGASIQISADFTDMTQFAGSYNLRGVTQNGFQIGDLVGLSTGLDGVIEARYSNGRSIPVAKLGLANFTDKNNLEKLGGMTYAESFSSGTVQMGTPQNNGFGNIQAGSLEFSNVDTAGELVKMIQTQRTYQASAQVISTSQTLTQTILNL